MSRRPPEDRWAVISWHEGLKTAEICRQTGFDRQFVTRCISKYNDSGSLDDAERAGRPRKLSKVWRTLERKIEGEKTSFESSDCKRAQETEGRRRELRDSAQNGAPSGFTRFQTASNLATVEHYKRGRLKFATANSNKDWSNVVFSDEHTFKQFKGGNPRHSFVWATSVSEVPGKEMERWG